MLRATFVCALIVCVACIEAAQVVLCGSGVCASMTSNHDALAAANEDFERKVWQWGMQDKRADAKHWYDMVNENRYYALGLLVPWVRDGVSGMLLAESTPASTRMMHQHQEENKAGCIIMDPYWKYYKVWWFQGLAFLNFSGMSDAAYEGVQLLQNLGSILADMCRVHNVDFQEYCNVYYGCFNDRLRELLARLGIRLWCHIAAGRSFSGYASLDVYIKVFAPGMDNPRDEAWYVVRKDSGKFWYPAPEDWWCLPVWTSVGQRRDVGEWYLPGKAGAIIEMSRTPAAQVSGERRMHVIARHIAKL